MNYKSVMIAIFIIVCACVIHSQATRVSSQTTQTDAPRGSLPTIQYGISKVNPDDYLVKYGDTFFMQLLVADSQPVRSMVMASGALSLYPFADTVMVAGKPLATVLNAIERKIGSSNRSNRVMVHLESIAPYTFSINGAIVNSGVYFTQRMITLNEALASAGGALSTASRTVTIIRNGQRLVYNLNLFYSESDLTMNPWIMQDDLILVDYAENYVKVFGTFESQNYIEYIELQSEKVKIGDILTQVTYKPRWSNITSFTVEREDDSLIVDRDFELVADDILYISAEERYIYVTGFVVTPDRFVYDGNVDVNYYLSRSGGPSENGSVSKLYIIREHGKRVLYTGQLLQPGDTIYVPESTKSVFITYLSPVATIVSLAISIIILGRG